MIPPAPDRWARLWRQADLAGDPDRVHQELVALYSQPHRHYHNLGHIAECLAEYDAARHLAAQPAAVELAIWFHDARYDTRASDNEERSAELARQRIADAGGSASLSQAVAALILATKSHDPAPHPDASLLVDADLSILGQPEARFLEYEAQIRREYGWVPETAFAAKRAEILERFLARTRLYSTNHFFVKYEKPARANLRHSIERLRRLR